MSTSTTVKIKIYIIVLEMLGMKRRRKSINSAKPYMIRQFDGAENMNK